MASAGAATVEKALDVLFHLHDAGASLGLSEIGRALDLPKSSCHRLLASLVSREVVERDDAGHYRPGIALLSLGIGAQGREPVVQAARPILEQEATALGETVFVVGKRGGRLRVLDKFEGSGFLRASPGIGDVIPSDVTAAGKLYQVYGEASDASFAVGSSSLQSGGESVGAGAGGDGGVEFVDSEQAAKIMREGYALNRDAWIEGLSVLGVPIWQHEGSSQKRLVGILALAAASSRFDVLGEEVVSSRLLKAAAQVAGNLGANRGRKMQ